MEFIDGWIIETNDGITYRLLILNGHPCGIWKALSLYHGQWYAIQTTDLRGTEEEILDSVNEENAVTLEIEFDAKKDPCAFRVIDKKRQVLFSDKDLRVCDQRIYSL
jgi:hypothetical protein